MPCYSALAQTPCVTPVVHGRIADMAGEKKGLRQLAAQTVVAYVRMASTVVIAVVVRLCLDCIGIILTDQESCASGLGSAHF